MNPAGATDSTARSTERSRPCRSARHQRANRSFRQITAALVTSHGRLRSQTRYAVRGTRPSLRRRPHQQHHDMTRDRIPLTDRIDLLVRLAFHVDL